MHEVSAEFDTSSTGFQGYEPSAETDLVAPPPAPPKPTLRRLFVGDDGLRAGWSVLSYLLLVALVAICWNYANKHFGLMPKGPAGSNQPSNVLSARTAAIGEAVSFGIFALPAFFMSLIEKRPFGRYGLGAKRMPIDFATGLFWGFAALSALVGTLYLLHAISFDGLLLHGSAALLYAVKWGIVFLFVALFEEFFFRGYLLYTVSRGVAGITRAMSPANKYSHAIGFWVSAAIFSIGLFMAAHLGNGGENVVGIFQVGLVGAVFAFSLYRTGSLWWAVGMHASWDWAQSYFYGTADSGTIAIGRLMASHPMGSKLLSGGADGPEGSVLGIPTLLLMVAVIHFTLPKREYPLTADQSPLGGEP
jgi:membrane protease YdiL (CAAX protease family)